MPPERRTLRRGLDIALPGSPVQVVHDAPDVTSVAVLGDDYRLRRPAALVSIGERVRCGQPVVADRETPGVVVPAPAAGVVAEIKWGEHRALRAVVIARDGDDSVEPVRRRPSAPFATASRDDVVRTLTESGLWTAIRARPFHRCPPPDTAPRSIFVTATDSEPLAPRPHVVIGEHAEEFADGVTILTRLTDGPVYVCTEANVGVAEVAAPRVVFVEFAGPHPSGLVGTHIHLLDPVIRAGVVWHVGYQDVIAIGRLMTTGVPWLERIIALAGPSVKLPRLLRTRLGANVADLSCDELEDGASRIISGSVLTGRQASGWGRHLGRFHRQICALPEQEQASTSHGPTTALGGRAGPFVPTEEFERVLPLDLLPSPLLRALVVGDDERARQLGCLELDNEDLALCTYVCPGKQDYGRLLSRTTARLEAAT